MSNTATVAVAAMAMLISFSLDAVADQSVRGYIKRDGTYLAPSMRSSPNSYKFDNYSSQGNGEGGTDRARAKGGKGDGEAGDPSGRERGDGN